MTSTLLLAVLIVQAPETQPRSAPYSMRIHVVDSDGKPLEGARIDASVWTSEPDFAAKREHRTDAKGIAVLDLPRTYSILRFWASKESFVSMVARWEVAALAAGATPPAEFTFRMDRGVTVGGRIVDEDGQPIAGAKVRISLKSRLNVSTNDGRAGYSVLEAAESGTDGRWQNHCVPGQSNAEFELLVSHPDFASDEFPGVSQNAAGITTQMLREQTAQLTLKRGVIVRGSVVDAEGKPIRDARIFADGPYFANHQPKITTDADGQFRLPALAPQHRTITVLAPDWAPERRQVNIRPGMPREDFRLSRGKPIQLRVVDPAGKPVAGALVHVSEWRGDSLNLRIANPTNAGGKWEWTAAPAEPLKLQIRAPGFALQQITVAGGEPKRAVLLKPDHRVTGTVTDAQTGQQISSFTIVPINVFRADYQSTNRHAAISGKDGRFEFRAGRMDIPMRLRVEALGYRSQDGPEFRAGDSSSLKQEFRLQSSAPIRGVVMDAADRPVNNAQVTLATPIDEASFGFDEFNNSTRTDAAGRFQFPDPGEPFIVVARSDSGFVQAEFPKDSHDVGTLKLQPWASIRGVFRDGGQPVRGATIFANPIKLPSAGSPQADLRQQVTTGPDGRFEFQRVPPGRTTVSVYLGPWRDEGFRSAPHVPLDLKPGQQVELALGGSGATLAGKVNLAGKVPPNLDCTYSINYLVRREPGVASPPEIAPLGFDARKGWQNMWLKTPEGQTFFSTLQSWFVKLAPDGSFRISGVPAGDYDLAIAVYAKPSGCLVDPLGRKIVRVTVREDDVARGRLEVPEMAIEIAPAPEIGDVPGLSFVKADGTAGSLADAAGKLTLVHFWASWCAPCKQQLPAVRRLHEQFAPKGLTTLGLSLDEDGEAWRKSLTSLELPWSQGRLPSGADAGVSSVPAYWLLDPQGRIVAKFCNPVELAKAIADRMK